MVQGTMPDAISEHTQSPTDCLPASDAIAKGKLGLGILLRPAYLGLRHRVNLRLADSGCNIKQFMLIHMLAERSGVTPKHLVENAGYAHPMVSQVFRVLEKKGIIARKADQS